MRQIILDTETTGLRVEEGHRIIEIGCLEMVNRKLTGRHYHQFINPLRVVDAGALAVHGITNEFLTDKPVFNDILQSLMDFISGAELIIHNAPFDVSFLNHELHLTQQGWKPIGDYCNIVDTLQIARQLHVGQRNSLDALCKRYGIDNSKRDLHGALLDANLLAQVYLAMTGGQGSFFDAIHESQVQNSDQMNTNTLATVQPYQLTTLMATTEELEEHQQYLNTLKKHGQCLWEEEERSA
jgi:DNA polymerase-3 subunit epsilon